MHDSNSWRNEQAVLDEPAFMPGMPVRSVLPERYEHGYAYPLIVLFHGRGGSEEQVLKITPKLSKQNFVYLSLRGPERMGRRKNGQMAYTWNTDPEMLGEYVRLSVQLARSTYHIHSERIYLCGVREGATAAFRAAINLGPKVAGVISLNGLLPRSEDNKPVFRMSDVKHLKCFLGYGEFNTKVAKLQAENDYRALYGAGADVEYRRYPTTHQLHPSMMTDVNNWLVNGFNAEHDLYADRDEDE